MGWLIGIGVIVLFGLIVSYMIGHRSFWFGDQMLSLVVIMIIVWTILGLSHAYGDSGYVDQDQYSQCERVEHKQRLVSITREKSWRASFVLGTGGGQSINRYYGYVETDKGLKLESFDVDITYIKEIDDQQPMYYRVDHLCKRTFRNWFWFGEAPPRLNRGRIGYLYVPKNTVLKQFEL